MSSLESKAERLRKLYKDGKFVGLMAKVPPMNPPKEAFTYRKYKVLVKALQSIEHIALRGVTDPKAHPKATEAICTIATATLDAVGRKY